jgi:hypothetical protein
MPSFEGARARRLADVNAKYAEVLSAGFPTATLTNQPEAETLQCRNELDRTNWLGLVVKCQYAISLGAGDVLAAGTVIRCTSNRMYALTPNEAYGRMLALLNQADIAQRNWWRLKDLVRAVEADRPTDGARFLAAIDLEAGWL